MWFTEPSVLRKTPQKVKYSGETSDPLGDASNATDDE
jgi:hypothetical protein